MDEIPTYNHSKPEVEEDEDKPSFYHKAAKIAFYAPLVGGIFLKSLEYSISDSKGSWVQWADFTILGVATILSLASIVLAIIALFGISTYGISGILWRSLRGITLSVALMWVLGTHAIHGYLMAKSEQLMAAMNKAAGIAKAQKDSSDAASTNSAAEAKPGADKATGAKPEKALTADEALIAKAMNVYLEKAQAFQRGYDTNADFLKTASVLDVKGVERKENFIVRKEAVTRFMDANEKLLGFINRGESPLRTELTKLNASPATMERAIRTFRQSIAERNFVAMKVRMTDQRIGTAMLSMLTILETNWGHWKYDHDKKQVIFQDTSVLESYLAYYKEMTAASTEQAQLQAELVKFPDTAAVK